MSESKIGKGGAILFVFVAALAACTSSNPGSSGTADGSTPATHVNCILTGRSGDPSSCSLFGSCNGFYSVDCTQAGCTCETMLGDAGRVKGKTVPFDPIYCDEGDSGPLAGRITYRVEEAFDAANAACGWGLH
ncbi:MAG: hypothetical protein ABIP39_04845 [Polyangiaceae bacterium]